MAFIPKNGRTYLWTQIHVSLVFFFIFAAYKALETLQSSLNFEAGLGTISISLVYAGYFCSSVFIGPPVVYLITPKWALFITLFSHTAFILGNAWPSWSTMIPTSLALGLAAGPYWIAQGTYATVLAVKYSEATGEKLEHVAGKFSGIFHVLWGASGPVGSLMSSLVLNRYSSDDLGCNNGTYNTLNISYHEQLANQTISECSYSSSNLEFCGPNHCPYMEEHMSALEKPSRHLVYILMGILLGFNIAGICLTGFLRNVSTTKQKGLCQRLSSTATIMGNLNLLLLIFPFLLVGVIPGTFYASFAQSYISCPFGIGMVGYAMLCEGVGFSVASFVCGPLSKIIPRVLHVSVALVVFTAMSTWWLIWQPKADQFWVVMIVALVYGSMHGTFRTHIAGLVSYLFLDNPEAAFAQYNLWQGVAYSASFAYTTFLCFNIKIYIFLGTLLLTAVSYLLLEFRIRNSSLKEERFEKSDNNKREQKWSRDKQTSHEVAELLENNIKPNKL